MSITNQPIREGRVSTSLVRVPVECPDFGGAASGTRAGDAVPTDPSTNATVTSGGSSTAWTLKLPGGAACSGDTATQAFHVYSFVVPAAVDPGTLTFNPSTGPSQGYPLDLATRASLAEVKRFYTERLTASGFEVTDLGTYSLNPATAALLGIAGALSAQRAATDDQIDIQIRTADGLIPSRMLQIHWRKISEAPLAAVPAQP